MIIINGNLLETPFQFIAHQVNCMGVMGAGLAKQIAQRYPSVYAAYGFGGSFSSRCKITSMENGNLAYFSHPHHNFDASQCKYYEKETKE